MSILNTVSWVVIALGAITALTIAIDVKSHPQHMKVMNITWPITGLYFPVIGWFLYKAMGRSSHASHHHHHQHDKPFWQRVFTSVTHCGGGCTLGDSIAAPLVSITGLTVLGSELLGHFVGEFIAAYLVGILFQFLPIMEMGEHSPGRALINAIKADTLSLVAFEIGMFGWIAYAFVMLLPTEPAVSSPVYWFMMQIAMIIGFATAYPANWLLVKVGIKHGM